MIDDIEQGGEAAIVIKTALCVSPQTFQWRCAITVVGRAGGLKVVYADFFGCVQVPAWFCKQRGNMTGGALSTTIEDRLATARRRLGITARRWGGRIDRQLVEMQVGKLWSDQIDETAHIVKSVLGSYWETGSVSEPRVIESSFSVHLKVRNKSIPMGHRTPTR